VCLRVRSVIALCVSRSEATSACEDERVFDFASLDDVGVYSCALRHVVIVQCG
jgi:hypothetical protein